MKPITNNRIVENSQPFKTHTFGIKTKNLSHIIGILRDDIYSDKILAVIREYSCNAYDANIQAGKKTTPIRVTLPSKFCPEFKVRDFGMGLSEDEIVDIFISYGESTKRNTNDAIGTLGIGSKSGFCYGDNFIVTSFHNGFKTVYDCVLDKTNVGQCLTLNKTPMEADEEEGIEITVNVKKDDVEEFRKKAINLYKYWNVKPELIGFEAKELEKHIGKVMFSGTGWTIYESAADRGYGYKAFPPDDGSLALMGNIAYPIVWENVRLPKTSDGIAQKIVEYLSNCKMIIHFPIGAVQMAPSREALQYTDHTNNAIAKVVKTIVDELEVVVIDKFKSAKNLFEAHSLFGKTFEGYGSNNLAQLRGVFEKKGILWKGIKIQSSNITGFNQFDTVKGYKQGGHDYSNSYDKSLWNTPLSHYTMRGSFLKQVKENPYHSTGISCADNIAVLLYDTTKHNYVRKAVGYLMEKTPSLKTVYVLNFDGKTALQDQCIKELRLDLVPMIKYSDIMEDVKKSIVRTYNGKSLSADRAKTVRQAKYITVADNTYDRYRRRFSDSWTSIDIDFDKDSGYYVELNKQNLVWKNKDDKVSNIHNVCRLVNALNNSGLIDVKRIHGFGPKILEGKVFDKTKWIRIETLLTDKLETASQEESLKWYIAFKKVQNNSGTVKVPSLTMCKRLAVKIADKNNPYVKLAELHKHIDLKKTTVYDELIGSCAHTIDCKKEVEEIEKLVKQAVKDYPMLVLARSYQDHYGDLDDDHKASEINTITAYINLVDSSK